MTVLYRIDNGERIALTPEEAAAWEAEKAAYEPPPPPPPPPLTIFKADIWRRATDEEAEAMDAMLAAQPVRLRNIFRDAQTLSSDDELYPTLLAGLTQIVGAERAAELLAPST